MGRVAPLPLLVPLGEKRDHVFRLRDPLLPSDDGPVQVCAIHGKRGWPGLGPSLRQLIVRQRSTPAVAPVIAHRPP